MNLHDFVYLIPSTIHKHPPVLPVRPVLRKSPGGRQVVGGGLPCSHDPGGGVANGMAWRGQFPEMS